VIDDNLPGDRIATTGDRSTVYFGGNIVVEPIVDIGSTRTLRYWTHRDAGHFDEQRRPVDGIPD